MAYYRTGGGGGETEMLPKGYYLDMQSTQMSTKKYTSGTSISLTNTMTSAFVISPRSDSTTITISASSAQYLTMAGYKNGVQKDSAGGSSTSSLTHTFSDCDMIAVTKFSGTARSGTLKITDN